MPESVTGSAKTDGEWVDTQGGKVYKLKVVSGGSLRERRHMKQAYPRRAFLAVALPAICFLTTTSLAQDCPPEEQCKDWVRDVATDGFWHDPDGENWGPPGPPGGGDTARHLTQGNAIVVGSGLDNEICKDFVGDGDDPDNRFLEILSGNTLTVERKIETTAESLEPFAVRLEDGEPGNPTTLRVGAQQRTESQVPEGFEMVVLRTTTKTPFIPDINNQSQVVWSEGMAPKVNNVFLWENGEITQITDDSHYDGRPTINNNGMIAWMRGQGPSPPWEIAIYQDGVISTIPNPAPGGAIHEPHINDQGDVLWEVHLDGQLGGPEQLFLYDGKTVTQFTDNNLANISENINNRGDILWSRVDFWVNPWVWTIMLYLRAEDVVYELTDGTAVETSYGLNDVPQALLNLRDDTVAVWEAGEISIVTAEPTSVGTAINNNGDISLGRWNPEEEKGDTWLYRDGQFYKLPDFGYSMGAGRINDRGEVVVRGFNYDTGINAILMLRRCDPPDGSSCTDDAQCDDGDRCTEDRCECGHCAYAAQLYGDVNDDGTVDVSDILCVLDAFQGDFSTCAMSRADIGPCIPDGTIDLLDIFSVLDAFAGQDPCCG